MGEEEEKEDADTMIEEEDEAADGVVVEVVE